MMMGRFSSDGPGACSKLKDETTQRGFAPSPPLPINPLLLPIIRTFAQLALSLKTSSLLFSRHSNEQALRFPTPAIFFFLLGFLFRSLTTGKFPQTHLSPSFFWVWENSPFGFLFLENVWRICPFFARRLARLRHFSSSSSASSVSTATASGCEKTERSGKANLNHARSFTDICCGKTLRWRQVRCHSTRFPSRRGWGCSTSAVVGRCSILHP